jgi:hypothetical protein
MKSREPYSYTIVRYVHDVMTDEAVNVGVILFAPTSGTLDVQVRTTISRFRGLYPDLNREAFTTAMHAVESSVSALARSIKTEGLLLASGGAMSLAARALPPDDSSLRCSSPAGTGLTDDVPKTLKRLFERYVSHYDAPTSHRRSDDDVWRPIRQKLVERDLSSVFEEKTIRGEVDEILFKHAWKNGLWHVYEPVSFDLADADGIKAKAREWRGHLAAVSDGATEKFKPHFIVGAPTRRELLGAYEAAIKILEKATAQPEIFEEGQVDDLVSRIEGEVRASEQSSRHH